MKKALACILAACILLGAAGCARTIEPAETSETPAEPGITIVTTIYPLYDWILEILGDEAAHADVTYLTKSGVDIHSYEPSVADVARISSCDVFVYVGGESENWVKDALKNSTNPEMVIVNLLDVLGDSVKEEEGEDGPEPDEHVWLSLKNAEALVPAIREALAKADPDSAPAYVENEERYLPELAEMDQAYAEAAAASDSKTVVFADRFPFRYLVEDYGLTWYAAFPGCSAETEASFETIALLSGKLDELHLPAVLTIEGEDHRVAETVTGAAKSGDVLILEMDSMQSVTEEDIAAGASYLGIMKENLEVLKTALGVGR